MLIILRTVIASIIRMIIIILIVKGIACEFSQTSSVALVALLNQSPASYTTDDGDRAS